MYANSLQRKILESGYTIRDIAKILNVDRTCMYHKVNNIHELTINEVVGLKNILKLSDSEAINIFFEV